MKQKLEDMIRSAVETSPEFEKKLSYWVNTRQRTPDLDWVLSQLVGVFGLDAVLELNSTEKEEKGFSNE